MAELKKELKDKEPKKSLCFNADNFDEIRKNKELDTFLSMTKDTKFPKLALKMFFKNCGAASSGNKAQSFTDHEETMDTNTDLGSSGYVSSLSSSFNNSYKNNIDSLRQNNKRLPDEDTLTVYSPTGDKDIKIHENKDNEIESKTTEQHHGGPFIQMQHEVKADASSQELMDSQDIQIDEMEEQSQTSDSVKRHEDVFLQKSEQFAKKERPQEDGLGKMEMQDTDIRETDDEPQLSYEPNDTRYERHQNEQFTKKETQLEDGRADMEDTHIRKTDEEPQRSYGPNDTRHEYTSVRRHESATCREMIMQHNEQENMQLDPEPFNQKQQQESNAGSVAEGSESNGTEIFTQNATTAIIASNGSLKGQLKAAKKRGMSKYQKENKKEEKDRLLLEWAKRQCNGSEEELKQIFDQIAIKNLAEHTDYPCFTAENVMVYKNLTAESQIIFITNDNNSISTTTKANYQMFVCNISKAIILGPKKPTEKVIEYAEGKGNIDKCTNFVFRVFAPILALFKKIQKDEKLYSLIVQ